MIALLILGINIVYVSLFTTRTIFMMKGRGYLAASVGAFEVMVYISGLGLVLKNLNQTHNIIAYAVGFALGVLVGMKIEEKLALGYVTVNVIMNRVDIKIPYKLRGKGYGVTSWVSRGIEGERLTMQILCPRKYESQLYRTIREVDESAFVITHEPKIIRGGFWIKSVSREKLEMESSR